MSGAGVMIRMADALHKATGRLEAAGIEQPKREARLLAAHEAGLAPGAWLDQDALIDEAALSHAVGRRAAREPLAFITGRRGFWTLDLEVSPDTLIPRADSETLIEVALRTFPDRGHVRRVLDLGTGTGCLLLAALSEFAMAFGVGIDRAPRAVALAARNAERAGLSTRSCFLSGDWARALAGRFDLILCNPPYIRRDEIAGLMPEVALHEPALALDGGPDGMDCYRSVLAGLPGLLEEGGVALLELGQGQEDAVGGLALAAGFTHISTFADLAGIVRVLRLGVAPG